MDGWLSGLKRRLAKQFGAWRRAGSNPAPSASATPAIFRVPQPSLLCRANGWASGEGNDPVRTGLRFYFGDLSAVATQKLCLFDDWGL